MILACLGAGKVSYLPRSAILCSLTFIRLDNVDSVGDHTRVVISEVARAMNVA